MTGKWPKSFPKRLRTDDKIVVKDTTFVITDNGMFVLKDGAWVELKPRVHLEYRKDE